MTIMYHLILSANTTLSVPRFLVIEGTFISARAGGMDGVPGIWSDDQIKQRRTITDAVHSKGSYIFCQLWALGRAGSPDILARSSNDVISSGDIPVSDKGPIPRPLSEKEIHDWTQDYVRAAKNAITAGFDGVEIHGANGYLPDRNFIEEMVLTLQIQVE